MLPVQYRPGAGDRPVKKRQAGTVRAPHYTQLGIVSNTDDGRRPAMYDKAKQKIKIVRYPVYSFCNIPRQLVN